MLVRVMTNPPEKQAAIESALRTVRTEHAGIAALGDALQNGLSEPFFRCVEILSQISGRIIVTGMGKSGHIGSKIAATLASTGSPAFFVHPAEANHGDLGMIARDDAIIAISWSGESAELKGIVAYSRRYEIPLIAITSVDGSALVVSAGAARTGVDASAASRTNEATAVQRATAYPYRGGVTAIKR